MKVQKWKTWVRENLPPLLIALALIFSVRSSLIDPFKIPSGSMIPTLLVGDHIFVNKLAYGLKVPFSDWFLDEPIYIFRNPPPEAGDIVVFKYPVDPRQYYIKRVVAGPGDTVEIRDKALLINGKPVVRRPLSDEKRQTLLERLDGEDYDPAYFELYTEATDEHARRIMLDPRTKSLKTWGPMRVPSEHYFVLGDNRDHSNDSRQWGFVPFRYIKGKAVLIWLSAWMDPDTGEFTFRPERSFTRLE